MQHLSEIKTRRSHRNFSPDPIPKEVLDEILNYARLAPSGHNRQPWKFLVITDRRTRNKITEITKYGRFVKDAPVCIAVFGDPGVSEIYFEDGCAATQNFLLAATALGLGSCWIGAHKRVHSKQVMELLGTPENLELVSLIALGKSKDHPAPVKKDLEELVETEHF